MSNSLVLLRITPLCVVAQWGSRAPPYHNLLLFLNHNGTKNWALRLLRLLPLILECSPTRLTKYFENLFEVLYFIKKENFNEKNDRFAIYHTEILRLIHESWLIKTIEKFWKFKTVRSTEYKCCEARRVFVESRSRLAQESGVIGWRL